MGRLELDLFYTGFTGTAALTSGAVGVGPVPYWVYTCRHSSSDIWGCWSWTCSTLGTQSEELCYLGRLELDLFHTGYTGTATLTSDAVGAGPVPHWVLSQRRSDKRGYCLLSHSPLEGFREL